MLDYCFPSLSLRSILPIFADWYQDGLELQKKKELIAHCKRKGKVPENDYFRFIFMTARGF